MRDYGEYAERQGFYVKVKDDWVGMYASVDGPKFFVNKRVFPLSGPDWDMELFVGKQGGLFTFYWQGESVISMRLTDHLEWFLWLYETSALNETSQAEDRSAS